MRTRAVGTAVVLAVVLATFGPVADHAARAPGHARAGGVADSRASVDDPLAGVDSPLAGVADPPGIDDPLANVADLPAGVADPLASVADPLARQSATGLGAAGVAISGGPSTGESVATGDVNGDGVTDVLVGVPFDDAGAPNAGAAYLFLGPVDADRSLADADATLVGTAPGDWAGFAVALADADGDGGDEAVVGAPLRDGGSGGVYLVDDPSGRVALGDAPAVSGPAGGQLGRAVAGAGDAGGGPDAAGSGETVLAGAPGARESAGAVFLLTAAAFGADGTGGDTATASSAAAATYRGASAGDRAGWSLAAGDVDGDGRAEPLVGARSADGGAGAVYVLADAGERAGGDGRTRSLAAAATVVAGPPGGAAGWSLAAGDVDGDGVADVLVGAPQAGAGGAAYVVAGGDLPARAALANATPVFEGRVAGDRAGWAVAAGCEGDGGGADEGGPADAGADVLVGAPHADAAAPDSGAVYRVAPDGSVAATYAGERAGEWAGYRLATGGDATGDGTVDVVVGAPGNESSGADADGATAAAYVVAGDCPASDGGQSRQATPTDAAGTGGGGTPTDDGASTGDGTSTDDGTDATDDGGDATDDTPSSDGTDSTTDDGAAARSPLRPAGALAGAVAVALVAGLLVYRRTR